jgi:hypothetical protein
MLLDARRPAQFALFHSHPEETDRVVRRNLDRDVGADVGTGDPIIASSGMATTQSAPGAVPATASGTVQAVQA